MKPFPVPPTSKPTFEITEFTGGSEREVHPYTTFVNHFYVYPISLSFDSQKLFSRARNITVIVELRENDNENSQGLNVSIEKIDKFSLNLQYFILSNSTTFNKCVWKPK